VLEDLVGCDVAVRRQSVVELGIILLIEGIVEVVNYAAQETFLDEPRGPNEIPLFFHSLPDTRWGVVLDVGVLGCWFIGNNVR
jgi:hypothetical protein